MSLAFPRVTPPVFSRHALLVLAAALVPTLASAQNGTVTGTVTNSATSAPVQNAQVTLCIQTAGGPNCFGGLTNASGVYSRSVPPGTYYVYTSSSGLVNEVFDNVPCPGSACTTDFIFANGTPVVVTAGTTVSGRNFALDPGGSISGTVVNATTGAPVPLVTVNVYAHVGGVTAFAGSGRSDATGAYSVTGLPTGTYYAFTSNSAGYTNEIHDNILCAGTCSSTLAGESGTGIAVVNQQATTGLNFALNLGGRITGTVTNAVTLSPVAGLSVAVYTRIGDVMSQVGFGITDASGVYTVIGLPAGTYYLATASAGVVNLLNEIYNNIPCAGSCVLSVTNSGSPVQLDWGATAGNIDFQLDPGGSVTGTITDAATAAPLSLVAVTIYRQVGSSVSSVATGFTNASGIYTASGVPSGTYFAVASSPTHVDEVYDDISCGPSCSAATILSGAPITVVAGAVNAGNDFALVAGGSISGNVTIEGTSAPLASLPVRVYTRVGATTVFVGSTSSDTNGAWSVAGLPTGTYYAFTDAFPGTITRWRDEIYNDIPCASVCSSIIATSSGTPIAVTAGAATPGIDFALSPQTGAPGPPSNFGIRVNAFVAQLSWSAPGTGGIATSYVIEAGLTPGGTLVSFPATGTALTVPGVPPGRFYVRVRAVNASGTSPPSNEYVIDVNPDGSGVLTPPQKVAARMNGGRLTVTWADPAFGGVPTSYVIEAGSGAGLSNIATLPVGSRSFTFEPVPAGVYFIRIRAKNGAQLSPPSGEAMIVVGNVPSPPEAPRSLVHTLSGSTLTLSWSAPLIGTPTSYIIEAGTASGLANIGAFPTGSVAVSATFMGVPPGTYYVRVRAVNAQGIGVASNERTVVVP